MIAAIYARKSTKQQGAEASHARRSAKPHGGDADALSVPRQIENARTFATAKGWRVDEAHIYSDDAISGAETRKLVNRQQLLDAALNGAGPPFQVLLMRDASRFSRRDGDEAFGELKRLAQAGVEIWFYQDGTRFSFGTFSDNVVGFVRAEMNAEYRRQVAKWTKEAMVRKAQQGYVCGGKVFGYDNVRVNGHVERRINDAHAVVIRRIFAMSLDGAGYSRIAKELNADGAVAPTPRKGTPVGWSPSSVREVLHRPLYRGEVIYNQTRRRDPDGTTTWASRPESEWLRVQRPELCIIPKDTWTTTHARLRSLRTHVAQVGVQNTKAVRRHRRDIESKYVLSGFARCAECGGSVGVLDRLRYGCIAFHKRGAAVCDNNLTKPIAELDAAVVRRMRELLAPAVVTALVNELVQEFATPTHARDLTRYRRELATVDRKIHHLTDAVAAGGQLPPLLAALKAQQTRREELAALIATSEAVVDATRLNRAGIERAVRGTLDDRQVPFADDADVNETRQALREMLVGPLTLTPVGRTYRFEGELVVGSLLLGSNELQPLWRARQDSNLRPSAPEADALSS